VTGRTDRPTASGPAAKPRRARRIGDLVTAELSPALRRHGFANAAIHLHWAEIVGAELARWSEPARLKWPPRPENADPERAVPATLVVRVEGAFALELQQREPIVVQRVNGYLGWRCVGGLHLLQAPVRKAAAPPARVRRPLTPAESRRLDETLAAVEDPALKASLARLGVGLASRRPAVR
jgi:hypothetical protein